MSMRASEFKQAVLNADISDSDWIYNLMETMPRSYAKGYLSRMVSELTESIETTSEYFREEILETTTYDIWG